MVVWCVWVRLICFKNPTRTNQLKKKKLKHIRLNITYLTMSTNILSSYKILFENRASFKRASYSLLLWSVQNWVSGGENTSIDGLHVHQASVQGKERASMSFWFLILCLLALTVVPLYHFVLTENEDVSIKCRKSRCNTFKDESQ